MNSGKSQGYLSNERIGLGLSLGLHIVVLILLFRTPRLTVPQQESFDVTIEPSSIAARTKQIVSPPLQAANKPPPESNRESEADSIAIKEQVRRGTEGGLPGERGAPSPPDQNKVTPQRQNQPQDKQPSPPSPSRQSEHHLKDLRLDDSTLALKFGKPSPSTTSKDNPPREAPDLANYTAFSRAPGSGATFVGSGGISDHLPNLPDGDITLLNAKANTYAGFVRRVAVQVFAQLRSKGWEKLSMGEVRRIDDFTTIEAILSPEGRFMTLRIVSGSGSDAFDSVVKLSVSSGANDPNPPSGARASDGAIHFIFKARSWSAVGINPRYGGASEHRWLLLATGLE